MPQTFRLVPSDRGGEPSEDFGPLSEALEENCETTAAHYDNVGFTPPWICYFAVVDDVIVGGGAFVAPPQQNSVEIAYFTLEEYQDQGIAGQTARALVKLARETSPGIELFAKTLPGDNPSTTILSKLGFQKIGLVPDDDVEEAMGWILPPAR